LSLQNITSTILIKENATLQQRPYNTNMNASSLSSTLIQDLPLGYIAL